MVFDRSWQQRVEKEFRSQMRSKGKMPIPMTVAREHKLREQTSVGRVFPTEVDSPPAKVRAALVPSFARARERSSLTHPHRRGRRPLLSLARCRAAVTARVSACALTHTRARARGTGLTQGLAQHHEHKAIEEQLKERLRSLEEELHSQREERIILEGKLSAAKDAAAETVDQ